MNKIVRLILASLLPASDTPLRKIMRDKRELILHSCMAIMLLAPSLARPIWAAEVAVSKLDLSLAVQSG